MSTPDAPLQGVRIITLAPNLPGPVAAARLAALGAEVTKIEPPAGDLLALAAPDYYAELSKNQQVRSLDLKNEADRDTLHELLADADLLLTSSRPGALQKMGLDFDSLSTQHPRLAQVAIVGELANPEHPGHDLTYQAAAGTLQPPAMPPVPWADMAGAERAVAEALLALHIVSQTNQGVLRTVGLGDVVADLAAPLRYGLTGPGTPLGGALPQYAIHPAAEGHVAVAALEPHFFSRLIAELGLSTTDAGALAAGNGEALTKALSQRTAAEWHTWAQARDLPITEIKTPT
ncbi:CoA transferase [Corynebacterium sp. TAE3-ERU12]|uniref:CoA transferase n=1 Tax=Corynebacterium sp. TAE3-ERU12 TaxID=2849491 RepID=UPI001C46348D|nr:CoA transferase [Corynebacterium sp. TAE3-ERU12]MBV7295680.1 CoA transferase [Corynebacterium sp. TAE3-ERU12]